MSPASIVRRIRSHIAPKLSLFSDIIDKEDFSKLKKVIRHNFGSSTFDQPSDDEDFETVRNNSTFKHFKRNCAYKKLDNNLNACNELEKYRSPSPAKTKAVVAVSNPSRSISRFNNYKTNTTLRQKSCVPGCITLDDDSDDETKNCERNSLIDCTKLTEEIDNSVTKSRKQVNIDCNFLVNCLTVNIFWIKIMDEWLGYDPDHNDNPSKAVSVQ